MSKELKMIFFGFSNAFRPVDYSRYEKLGSVSKRIHKKVMVNREITLGKINEVTEKSSASEIYTTA